MERKIAIVDGWIEKADEATGTIVAVVNTGNVKDLQGDTMVPGCWSKVLREKQSPAICWFHEISDIRGSVLSLEELKPGDPRVPLNQTGGKGAGTASGLRMKGQFEMETQAGRDAFVLVKNRRVKQWSVQFDLDEKGAEPDGKGGRNIKQVNNLYEVSPVLVGASPGTATLSLAAKQAYLAAVKADDPVACLQTIHDMTMSYPGVKCLPDGKSKEESLEPSSGAPPPDGGPSSPPPPKAVTPHITALPPKVIGHIRAAAKLAVDKHKEEQAHA